MKDLFALFIHELKSIYNAEQQIVKALPEMIKGATSPKLKEAFSHHLKETKEQVHRLEQIGKELDTDLSGYECIVMHALLKEGHKLVLAKYDHTTKDAGLINCAQHVELYEIASYGVLKAFAKHFKFHRVEELLELSSREEGHANKTLNELAEGTFFTAGINAQALKKCA